MKAYVLFLFFMISLGAHATSVIQHDMKEVTQLSGLVFQGQVSGLKSYRESNGTIYTEVNFDIHEVIKGDYPSSSITLRYLGGTVDGMTMNVIDSDVPSFGQLGIYFVAKGHENLMHPLSGWGQGHYVLKKTAAGTRVFSSNGKAITDVSMASAKVKSAKSYALNSYEASGLSFSEKSRYAITPKDFKLTIRDIISEE
ncbi:hypothetical protein [Pseudoteredinibacter isoporae]|uniref:hypothetical protein n=1 Tax=Pseudoteredinibacter isoporae TaxID=570281 RepID=UPI003107330D